MQLPVANSKAVLAYAKVLIREHRAALFRMLSLYAFAAVMALVPAWVIGEITNFASYRQVRMSARSRTTSGSWSLRRSPTPCSPTSLVVAATVLGETVFAQLREELTRACSPFRSATSSAPGHGRPAPSTRPTTWSRSRAPCASPYPSACGDPQALLTMGAMLLVSPLASVASLVSLPVLLFSTRYYLRYATPGYRRERMSYATMSGSVAETAEGARTINAHRLGPRQVTRIEDNVRESFYSEMYTLLMRMIWFPTVEGAFALAVAVTLAWSGWLAINGHVSIGAATTVTLYVVQINDPLDRIVSWLDEIQIGQTSLARLVGVSVVHDDRPTSGPEPSNETITLENVRYAYRQGHDVLNGVNIVVRPGERLAIVGPSGAGKSTIGRLIAGIDAPRTGSVRVGDVELAEMPLVDLRRHVALVTQEHHIFIGTVRDNLALARPESSDAEIEAALAAVDALDWVRLLPDDMSTELGTTGYPITPAQAQQLALARLVLSDPHTLVLDEATALLDPRAARHLERSLSAVLEGRTVIAIAHRLHTAHDADRVCVVVDGVVAGSAHTTSSLR